MDFQCYMSLSSSVLISTKYSQSSVLSKLIGYFQSVIIVRPVHIFFLIWDRWRCGRSHQYPME